MFIANFFFGLIIMAIGIVMLRGNHSLTNMFSRNNVFERHLGSGSTYLVMKIVALIVIFFGLLMTLSLHDNLIDWMLSPVADFFKSKSST